MLNYMDHWISYDSVYLVLTTQILHVLSLFPER